MCFLQPKPLGFLPILRNGCCESIIGLLRIFEATFEYGMGSQVLLDRPIPIAAVIASLFLDTIKEIPVGVNYCRVVIRVL
jgi:hypothetical protein